MEYSEVRSRTHENLREADINSDRHLARFVWTSAVSAPFTMKVEVFRSDPSATRPFFTASIQPINYTPSFRSIAPSWAILAYPRMFYSLHFRRVSQQM